MSASTLFATGPDHVTDGGAPAAEGGGGHGAGPLPPISLIVARGLLIASLARRPLGTEAGPPAAT